VRAGGRGAGRGARAHPRAGPLLRDPRLRGRPLRGAGAGGAAGRGAAAAGGRAGAGPTCGGGAVAAGGVAGLGRVCRVVLVAGGAAAGGLIVLAWARRRAGLLVGAGVVAVLAFCVLAVAGLPIVTRYLLLPGAILCVFAGAGAFGWLNVEASHPQRWMWVVAGAVVVVA